jgi:hypothetical protein
VGVNRQWFVIVAGSAVVGWLASALLVVCA